MRKPDDNEIHIWWTPLLDAVNCLSVGPGLLSAEEQVRAARYRSTVVRSRFMRSRSALRMILAQYTGTNPAHLDLRFHPGGKPYLHRGSGIEFNLSHSDNMLVVAVSSTPLGVDLEAIRPVPYALTVAEHWFAPVEYAACLSHRGQDRELAFLRLWTRKEAYLKAQGEGLQRTLNSFAVTAEEGAPKLLWDAGSREGSNTWLLFDLKGPQSYIGALATTRPCTLRYHTFVA